MATRKPKQAPPSFTKRISNILKDDRLPKITGLFCYLLAIFLFISFTSYLFTWKADSDFLQPFKWDNLFEAEKVAQNWFGKLGALASHLIIFLTFGLSSFALILLLIRIGYRLINGEGSALIWPMFRNVFFAMVLGAVGTWLLFGFVLLAIAVWFRNANPEMWSFKKYFPEFNRSFFSFLNFSGWIESFKRNNLHNDEYGDDSEIVEDVDEEIVEDNSLIINKSFDDEFEAVETTFTKRIPSSYNQDVPFELEETETNVQPSNGQIATQEELGFEIDEIFSTMRQDKDTEQEAPIYELTKDEEELLKVRAELDNPDEPYNPILELS